MARIGAFAQEDASGNTITLPDTDLTTITTDLNQPFHWAISVGVTPKVFSF